MNYYTILIIAQLIACRLCGTETTSMIEIIANPGSFNGKEVAVSGFAVNDFEGVALYFSREDWIWGRTKNALWYNIDDGNKTYRPNRENVTIYGVFNKEYTGHMGLFSGSIDHVKRIQKTKSILKDVKE